MHIAQGVIDLSRSIKGLEMYRHKYLGLLLETYPTTHKACKFNLAKTLFRYFWYIACAPTQREKYQMISVSGQSMSYTYTHIWNA